MNSLLSRQIDKYLKKEGTELLINQDFINAINDSYNNYDEQLKMSQRAMKISSDELYEVNDKLRLETINLKEINKNLEEIINSMAIKSTLNEIENEKDLVEKLKKQTIEIISINKQREALLKDLEEQNQELNEYAHVVSHDLKAPLRNIHTLVSWFIEDNKDRIGDDCLNSLNSVLVNVEKMDLLIKGILEYSTIDKLETGDRLVDFNILCEEVLKTFHVSLNTKVHLSENLPKIYGNTIRFKQIFQNLIENALNSINKENGTIEIGYENKKEDHLFYVKDNGKGISPIYFDKIFNVFTKLESNNKSSGIGLSIVKKIVQFYNGTIWVESQENEGATFYFTLPKLYGKSK
ncbi:sensor histidine kinase [Flavobacterium oreochromis]|uniref:histidine kinase n=1 Tax=Flavobacterium columnare TaxID=996 RepID=A0A246GAT6_9FLAO|nr:ATP-binding protein [Flavobacterium oreochromis]OWP77299.1 two-component sensor histidine kinase [Flavobacterium oreochromis]QYS87372.1 GHKL domain-containing protein [Flavobacterium oreochromis]